MNMNTGDKNTKGRAILKGPRGGLYVIGPSGTKLSTFTKAKAAAPAAAPVRAPTSRASTNTVTHKGMRFTRMGNASVRGNPVYKKNGYSTYYVIGRNGVPRCISVSAPVNKVNGTSVTLKNYKKSKEAPAPAPVRAPAPEGSSPALLAAIAHVRTLKTMKARSAYVQSRGRNFSTPNFATLAKHAKEMNNANRAKRAAKKTGATVAAPAVAPATHMTADERNRRLATIRARLNAMRAAKLAAMPKRRANVDKRLKNAVARVRARLLGNRPTEKSVTIPFCHEPASVPRKPCTMRKAKISVYKSPMVDDGTMVATRASDIDLDWFKRQDAYIKNLNDYDFWTAQAHTNRSHTWIGPFLYRGTLPTYLPESGGKHIVPLWPQIRKMIMNGTFKAEGHYFWVNTFKALKSETDQYKLYASNTNNIPRATMKLALEMYRDDLKRIIAAAPKSRKKMILYRGSSFDIFRSTKGHWHNLESFCSAAYNLKHALGYGTLLQRITVLPGTPVLLVAGMNQWGYEGEYEIMVNYGTKYLIRGRGIQRRVMTGYSVEKLRITDVTIAK